MSTSFRGKYIIVSRINQITYYQQTRRTDTPLAYFSESRLPIVVAVLNVILAAVLLFGAILNLYYVQTSRNDLV